MRVVIIASVALAAYAGLTTSTEAAPRSQALTRVLNTLPKKRSLTKVSTSSAGLCGSPDTLEVPLQSICQKSQQTVLSEMKWEPCCPFENPDMEHCRTYEVGQPYCASSVPSCLEDTQGMATCDDLSESDTMTLSLSFREEKQDSCCRTCTCFGDPECVDFSGQMDLWIPCDARKSPRDCKMHKDICEGLMGPNGQQCVWDGKGSTSKGTNFPVDGSPCKPQGTAEEITMAMFDSGSNLVELGLGERGIIELVHIKLGGVETTLDAAKCFSEGGAAAWGLDELPSSNWVETVEDPDTLISWRVKDPETKTLLRLVCLRAMTKSGNGHPRINVQELAVGNDYQGDGFCSSGVIGEKNGDYLQSENLHQSCVQNQTDALQACKFLVEMGTPSSLLKECAASYCNRAATGQQACKRTLKKADNSKGWMTAYCQSVLVAPKYAETAPQSMGECKRVLKAEGYGVAVELWGQGYKVEEESQGEEECGSSIVEYEVLPGFSTCEFGINIQVYQDDGSWVTKYFVPKSKPLCDNTITVNAVEARELFTKQVRVQQCDSKGTNKECQALNTCDAVFGADFQISYSSQEANLQQLLEAGLLQCATLDGDNTWCLPEGLSVPIEEVCLCEPGPGRRALLDLAR